MTEYLISTPSATFMREFTAESLAPPDDHMIALASARRGERRIDPLAALIRNANVWEAAMLRNEPTADKPHRRELRRAA
jgi:uncharacterized protein (DUF2236 family)